MSYTVTENEKTVGAFIHMSTLLKYFFPFANFIAPLVLWTLNKEKLFVDYNGKQAINFQLSMFLYTLIIGLLCIPFFFFFASDLIGLLDEMDHAYHYFNASDLQNLSGYIILLGIAGLLIFGLFVFELYAVISATMHSAKGIYYKYPLCIAFISTKEKTDPTKNQENYEHAS